jgi:hypothetical protein
MPMPPFSLLTALSSHSYCRHTCAIFISAAITLSPLPLRFSPLFSPFSPYFHYFDTLFEFEGLISLRAIIFDSHFHFRSPCRHYATPHAIELSRRHCQPFSHYFLFLLSSPLSFQFHYAAPFSPFSPLAGFSSKILRFHFFSDIISLLIRHISLRYASPRHYADTLIFLCFQH